MASAGWQAVPNTAAVGGHSASRFMATPPQHRLYFSPEPQGQGSFRRRWERCAEARA